jgi:hypothetical protein
MGRFGAQSHPAAGDDQPHLLGKPHSSQGTENYLLPIRTFIVHVESGPGYPGSKAANAYISFIYNEKPPNPKPLQLSGPACRENANRASPVIPN